MAKKKKKLITFKDLVFTKEPEMGNEFSQEFFSNGYGASIIRGKWTYGGDKGLYELAVLKGSSDEYSLTYKTPVTSDVEGYLTPRKVTSLLKKIQELPSEK